MKTVSAGQMEAYLRFARGFTGSGAVKNPQRRDIGAMPDTGNTLIIREDEECTLWVELVTAPTRDALSASVSQRNWGDANAPLGTIYSKSAQLLRAYKVDRDWVGVVIMGAYRDV